MHSFVKGMTSTISKFLPQGITGFTPNLGTRLPNLGVLTVVDFELWREMPDQQTDQKTINILQTYATASAIKVEENSSPTISLILKKVSHDRCFI